MLLSTSREKKQKKILTYFHNQVPRRKKRKGNINDISNDKKKHPTQPTFIAQAKIQVQEVFPKEKK